MHYNNLKGKLYHVLSGSIAKISGSFDRPFLWWNTVDQFLSTETGLRRLHEEFGLGHADKLENVLKNSELSNADSKHVKWLKISLLRVFNVSLMSALCKSTAKVQVQSARGQKKLWPYHIYGHILHRLNAYSSRGWQIHEHPSSSPAKKCFSWCCLACTLHVLDWRLFGIFRHCRSWFWQELHSLGVPFQLGDIAHSEKVSDNWKPKFNVLCGVLPCPRTSCI